MAEVIYEVVSKFEKRIRLTKNIWQKIRARHPEFQREEYLQEILQTIQDPAFIIKGWTNECLSLRWCTIAPKVPKYLCVVYRELNNDGFIVTAFFISRHERLLRREVIWRQS